MKTNEAKGQSLLVYLAPDVSFKIAWAILGFLTVPVLVARFADRTPMSARDVELLSILLVLPLLLIAYQFVSRGKVNSSRPRLELAPHENRITFLPGRLPYEQRQLPWDALSPLQIHFDITDWRFDGDHGFHTGFLRVKGLNGQIEEVQVPGLRYGLEPLIQGCEKLAVPIPIVSENYRSLYGREQQRNLNLRDK